MGCLILLMVGELKHARCASLEYLAGNQAIAQEETKIISTLTIPAWILALASIHGNCYREEALEWMENADISRIYFL